uniref:Uncharacterized protein n=1 Tax=viral metagenome TaxID=1070528 RepID=A0A6C0JXR2_9ZZZZ
MSYFVRDTFYNPNNYTLEAKVSYAGKEYPCKVEEPWNLCDPDSLPEESKDPALIDVYTISCEVPDREAPYEIEYPIFEEGRLVEVSDPQTVKSIYTSERYSEDFPTEVDLSQFTNLKHFTHFVDGNRKLNYKFTNVKCRKLDMTGQPGLEDYDGIEYETLSVPDADRHPDNFPPIHMLTVGKSFKYIPKKLDSIRELRFYSVSEDLLKSGDLTKLPSLEKLHMDVGDLKIVEGLLSISLPNIKSLSISGLGEGTEDVTIDLVNLPNLERFFLRSTGRKIRMVNVPDSLIEFRGDLDSLTSLPTSVVVLKTLKSMHYPRSGQLMKCSDLIQRSPGCNVRTIRMSNYVGDVFLKLTTHLTTPWKKVKSARK